MIFDVEAAVTSRKNKSVNQWKDFCAGEDTRRYIVAGQPDKV
jgi:hypothetical protein